MPRLDSCLYFKPKAAFEIAWFFFITTTWYLMLLHRLNEIFRASWTWISDCRASSTLKTVPVSQDSKEYAKCKLGEFVHNNTKPLLRIACHFWTNTKYASEVSLIISVDIHRESRLTQCVRTLIFSKCRTHWDFTLCQNSTVASTFNLQSLEISKQISCVLRRIKRAIPRKLVNISDCRVSSFLKTVPGRRVSRHSELFSLPLPRWLLPLVCPRNLWPLPRQKLPLALPELIFS